MLTPSRSPRQTHAVSITKSPARSPARSAGGRTMEDGTGSMGLIELPWIRYWNNNGSHGEGSLEEVVEKTCVPTQGLLRVLRGWRSNPVNGWYFKAETEWPQDDGYEVGATLDGRRVPKCFHQGSPGRISRPLMLNAWERAMNGDVSELIMLTHTPENLEPDTNDQIRISRLTEVLEKLYPHYPHHNVVAHAVRLLPSTAEDGVIGGGDNILRGSEEFHNFMSYLNLFIRCWVAFDVEEEQPFDLETFIAKASDAGIQFHNTIAEQSFNAIDRLGHGAVFLSDICYWFATSKDIIHRAPDEEG